MRVILPCIHRYHQKKKSVPEISLTEPNEYGQKQCMSLHTGKHIHSRQWEETHIDEEVIQRV